MIAALTLSLFLAQGYAPPREGLAPLDSRREERVTKLGKQLRCAVCQGLSIADSPSSIARAQLDKVRELISEGKSDQEIYDYFVQRYGEWVLLKPTTSGSNMGLYLLPLLLLLIGVIVIFMLVRKEPPAAGGGPGGPVASVVAEDEFLKAVRQDIEKP